MLNRTQREQYASCFIGGKGDQFSSRQIKPHFDQSSKAPTGQPVKKYNIQSAELSLKNHPKDFLPTHVSKMNQTHCGFNILSHHDEANRVTVKPVGGKEARQANGYLNYGASGVYNRQYLNHPRYRQEFKESLGKNETAFRRTNGEMTLYQAASHSSIVRSPQHSSPFSL